MHSRSCIRSVVSASVLLWGGAQNGWSAPRPTSQHTGAPGESAKDAVPSAVLRSRGQPKPPPLHVDYASHGVAIATDILLHPGATCRERAAVAAPCILGSGGGLVVRGGYRSPGPWYVGGAYQFSKTDSSNLYRMGVLQQLRVEMRYMLDVGYRLSPYAAWGLGGVAYGNEWGVETGGGSLFGGLGFELQLSRVAVLGLGASYQPMVLAGWTDTAGYERDVGMAHTLRIELQLEVRSQLRRR